VSSILAAIPPIGVHGKFFSRDGAKFLLKAMRLPGVSGSLDLSEKLALRRRLDEFADANVNTLILTAAQAETVLGLAGQSGLHALVEITIDSWEVNSAGGIRDAVARVAQTVSVLRGYTGLMGFLVHCPCERGAMTPSAFDALRMGLAAVARTIHESHGHQLIAFEHSADVAASAPAGGDSCEDFTYVRLGRIDAADLSAAITALHHDAVARPLVIEIGEEWVGQVEITAHALGLGAAGVVASPARPAVSPGWYNGRMLDDEKLLPFAQIGGSSTPLPATTPMVSVVIAARDNEATLAACLESIGRLHYPNYEVIVVDDGSRDRTAEIAATVGGARPIRIIREHRAGVAAACNVATRAARGQFIAFTRGDCEVDADWLALGMRVMIEGSLDACRGPIYPSPIATEGIAARAIGSLPSQLSMDPGGDRAELLLTGRNMIVRKASLAAVGGFDSRFIDSGGDADLAARMIEARMALGWCPAGLVWRCASSRVGEFYQRRIRHGRADAMLAIKHPERFGGATWGTHFIAAVRGGWPPRVEGTRERVVVRGLSTIFSLSGAIAQALACRYYMITADRALRAANDSNGDDYDSTRHLPIANNHAHTAHPAGHR
jgi:GT2 family glycosyltransferase